MEVTGPPLELRFTGGWVRDKLLGVQSHDIDVALSTMTGWQFGLQLQQFVEKNGSQYEDWAASVGVKAELGGLHQIAANPEKSKHLETITTRMFGFDIDFVNLRKESYSEESRNPQMEFGTPEEDALRRDATINAMFYNLHSMKIEDFTNKGMEDMDKEVIRTPLAPFQTFKDDPLRVLRLIRFASRLGYTVEPNTELAMKEKSIHDALRAKISRERVGVEVGKMVWGPDPHRALMLISDLDLYASVFANPKDDYVPDLTACPRVYDGLQIILSKCADLNEILHTSDDIALCWYLAAYVPWADKKMSDVVGAAREGIKATNHVSKVLGDAVKNRKQVLELVDEVGRGDGNMRRSLVGMTLRGLGSSWRWQVLYSMLCDFASEEDSGKAVIEKYSSFLAYLKSQNLLGAAEMVPVINGNKIRRVLDAGSGPWLRRALEMVMEWQLDNPEGKREDAAGMISQRRGELGL